MGEKVFGSTDLALKSARIVDFCGKSSGFVDFENRVDRRAAVNFGVDSVFTFRILLKKFSSLFSSQLYNKNAPRGLIGSVMHLKPIILYLLPFSDPIHIIFVLVLFRFRPDNAPKLLII